VVVKGFVLAGGGSSRFGSDKALHPVNGTPMVLCVAEALLGAGLEVRLVVRDGRGFETGMPVIEEAPRQGFHPLHGLVTALKSLEPNECALIAPCDMPYLRSEGIEALLSAGAPAVAFDGTQIHPLLALVPANWIEHVEKILQREGAAVEVFDDVPRVAISADQLVNVNRPEDLLPSGSE
jgi:molybdopterin-guanine dinucleotide biosynthesis protein A